MKDLSSLESYSSVNMSIFNTIEIYWILNLLKFAEICWKKFKKFKNSIHSSWITMERRKLVRFAVNFD